MDNRDTEANRSSPPRNPPSRAPRPARQRAQYNNWASSIRRVPATVSRGSNTSEDRHRLNNGTADNRDSYVEGGRNLGSSPNLPTIFNDLTSTRESNETTDNSADIRSNHSNPNNNSNQSDSSVPSSDNDSVARGMNTANRTRSRRRNPNNVRGGGTVRSNASTSTRAYNNTTSPVRGNNPRRVPPLRLRGNSPSQTNPDLNNRHSNLLHSLDLPEMELVFPSPFQRISFRGTADNPIVLSSDDQPEPSSNLTDEEFARQLQQEEWERSNTPQELSFFPSSSGHFIFGRPPRRNLAQSRRRLETSFPHGSSSREGLLSTDGPPDGNRPGRLPFSPMDLRSGPLRPGSQLHLRNQAAAELIPFIFDLFHSHGIPDAEVMNILNPDRADAGDYETLIALAEQVGEVSRGLSQADINKLPTQKHNSESSSEETGAACGGEEPQCNICLMEYKKGDTKRVMPCQHEFHKECVDQWLKTNATCPVCRSDVKLKRS